MSKQNLQRALWIERNLTDSMKELLDAGEINIASPDGELAYCMKWFFSLGLKVPDNISYVCIIYSLIIYM